MRCLILLLLLASCSIPQECFWDIDIDYSKYPQYDFTKPKDIERFALNEIKYKMDDITDHYQKPPQKTYDDGYGNCCDKVALAMAIYYDTTGKQTAMISVRNSSHTKHHVEWKVKGGRRFKSKDRNVNIYIKSVNFWNVQKNNQFAY